MIVQARWGVISNGSETKFELRVSNVEWLTHEADYCNPLLRNSSLIFAGSPPASLQIALIRA